MSLPSDHINRQSDQANRPATLWEAMGQLHQIQTQEKIALDRGDIELFRQLLQQQDGAWKVVYLQANKLIANGRAPTDMIQRLEKILNIHHDNEQRILQADAAIRGKLQQLQDKQRAA